MGSKDFPLPNAMPSSTSTDPSTLTLASVSPRRRELIAGLGVPVRAVAPRSPEDARTANESPEQFALRLSRAKAQSVADGADGGVVLGADTVVVLDDDVLGKPATLEEAADMLTRLRGRTHRVVTAVAALETGSGRIIEEAASTEVRMRQYSDVELKTYVATGGPLDKAGAYGIQDTVFCPAESVNGCYLNVVGLPLCLVSDVIQRLTSSASLDHGGTAGSWVNRSSDGCPHCASTGPLGPIGRVSSARRRTERERQ